MPNMNQNVNQNVQARPQVNQTSAVAPNVPNNNGIQITGRNQNPQAPITDASDNAPEADSSINLMNLYNNNFNDDQQ